MQINNSNSDKRFWLLLVVLILSAPLCGQNVRNESGTINSRKYQGFSLTIDANHEKVTGFWLEELKKTGKTRRKRDFYQIDEFKLQDGSMCKKALDDA